ncbi:MAG: hypothetical protein PHU69_14790, partial [Fermentimonas sp.]|nr:hypothetical protein [Fermentimonas sp.]
MSFTAVISANIKDFESNLQKAQNQMDAFDKKIGVSVASIGRAVEGVGKKMSILSAGLVVAGGKAFTMAADFQDAIGATDQIFNDASDTVNNWAKNLSSDFGIAKEEALKYSNLMGSMLINIGQLTEEQAAKQSAKLIELAGDLTAMYGGTTQDAVRALTGALKGNNTMLDNYGMAVNDALVKQKAFELGLSSGTGELSLQAKQAATLALIWEQTGAAQGQASREADTASGAMRALSVEVKNLSTEIGEVLLPIITPIIAKIKEFVSGLRELSPEMLRIGVVVAGVVAAIGPLLIMIGKILQMLPLIKVAIGALTGPIGLVVGVATAGIITIIKNWDMLKNSVVKDIEFVKNQFETTSNFITNTLKGDFKGAWADIKAGFNDAIDYFKRRWSEIKELFGGGGVDGSAVAGVGAGALGQFSNEIEKTKNEIEKTKNELGGTKTVFEDTRNTFDKFIESTNSINQAVLVATQTIANLKQRILDLQTGRIFSEDVTGEIIDLKNVIKELETGLDTLTRKTWNVDFKINNKPPSVEGKTIKDEFLGVITDRFNATIEKAQQFSLGINNTMTGLVNNISDAFGRSLGNKDVKFGDELLGVLGSLLQELGSMAVAFGAWSLGMQPLLGNPLSAPAAIAAMLAGAAAIAAGAAIKANKATSSLSGGGGTASYKATS